MKQKLYLKAILLIGILLALNLIANDFHLRMDLTSDKQYTLSDATVDILKNLEEPITVKAYFSVNLPSNVIKTRQDFQEMLIEYANRAHGMLQYEFINPNDKDSQENEAVKNGIRPVMINIREKDQVKQQKAFLGATLSMGDKKEVIPFLQPGAPMEYALTTAIKKISVTDKPLIGFIEGHGEPPLSELAQVDEQLSVLYTAEEVRLMDTTSIPEKIKTLVWVRPLDSIPFTHFQKLDAFLAKGNHLVVAIDRVRGNFQTVTGTTVTTGLEGWLQSKGIHVEDAFLIDAKCGSVNVVQQQGTFSIQSQLSFPFLPLIEKFSDHPISKGLESVFFEFVSPISYQGDTTKRFIPLAFSSEKSDEVKPPVRFEIQKQWSEADFSKHDLVVAAAVEGKLAGATPSKLVVIGNGDFVITGPQQQQQKRQADNINLLTNSIDWLSDDTGLISLRTKGVTTRPIRQLQDSTRMLLKYLNFLLPILLAVGYGVARWQRGRNTRLKRMNENYEEA